MKEELQKPDGGRRGETRLWLVLIHLSVSPPGLHVAVEFPSVHSSVVRL